MSKAQWGHGYFKGFEQGYKDLICMVMCIDKQTSLFRFWLHLQVDRDDRVGDVARDDKYFYDHQKYFPPEVVNLPFKSLGDWMRLAESLAGGAPLHSDVKGAMRDAWFEFKGIIRKMQ